MKNRPDIRSPQPIRRILPACGNLVIIVKTNDVTVDKIMKLLRDDDKTSGLYKQ